MTASGRRARSCDRDVTTETKEQVVTDLQPANGSGKKKKKAEQVQEGILWGFIYPPLIKQL